MSKIIIAATALTPSTTPEISSESKLLPCSAPQSSESIQSSSLSSSSSSSSTNQLMGAVLFACEQHRKQRRKNRDRDPYINHPAEVAYLCSQAGCKDTDVLIAALLHDTVEDTGLTFEQLEIKYGPTITNLVRECTDDKSLDKVTRKKLQIEHAESISNAAKLIKLCDKYSNLNNLLHDPPQKWSPAQIRGYQYWSYAVCQKLKSIQNETMDKLFAELWRDFGFPETVTQESLNQELEAYYLDVMKECQQ